jgi:DNA gyrase subunit A
MGMTMKEEDVLVDIFACNSLDHLLFFSDKGKVYAERAFRIPEAGRANKGMLIHMVLNLEPDEYVTAVLPVTTFEDQSGHFTMLTKKGRIKRVAVEEFAAVRPSGLIAMGLEPDDHLNWVKFSDGDQDIMIATEMGQSIRFHESEVRVMGRPAGGVHAIKFEDNLDVVAGMDVLDLEQHTHMLIVTRNGYGKRTLLSDYRSQGRYGLGVRTLARNEKTGAIVDMRCINAEDDIMLITKYGVVLRTNLDEIRETGRSTQGVKVMNLQSGDQVIGIAIMTRLPDEPSVNGETEPGEGEPASDEPSGDEGQE